MDINLTTDIMNARARHGFIGATVIGPPGIGKSVYCMLIAKELYYLTEKEKGNNPTSDECWEFAINQIVHSTEQLAKGLQGYNYRNKRLIIIWDDAGVGAGSYAFSKGYKYLDALTNALNLIRTSCDCLLITTVAWEGLGKFIRNMPYFRINISKSGHNKYDRMAITRYKVPRIMKKSQMERMIWRRRYREYYSCYMPNNQYSNYVAYRENMMDDALSNLINEHQIIAKRMKRDELKINKELKELDVNESSSQQG